MERFHFAVRLWLLCAAVLCGLGTPMFAQTLNPFPIRFVAPIVITSAPVTTAVAGNPYRYQVRTSTATANANANANASANAVVYRLTTAPSGMTIDSVSGVIVWLPASTATVRVTVRASLATNANVNQTQQFSVNVLPRAAAQAMVRFLTTAPSTGNVGMEFLYSARAFYGVDTRLAPTPRTGTQAIAYSLANAPSGMTIDASNGTVRWTPSTTGTVRFIVRAVATTVANTTMNSATQDVEMRVSQQMPRFFSQSVPEAFVGYEYTYRAIAGLLGGITRPSTPPTSLVEAIVIPFLRNVPMTYILVTAPQGMTIEATSGTLRWTPASTSASVRVVIRASVVGNTSQSVTQDFSLKVSFPRVNFLTQAPNSGVIGQSFVYNPVAVVGNTSFPFPLPLPIPVPSPRPDSVRILPFPQGTPGLVFTLITAPLGMSIDAASGVVRWMPSSAGTVQVNIRATLATNQTITGTQNFSIRISQPQARFLTSPGTAYINLGSLFTYRTQAQIPTMTTASLRYALDAPPSGMTIDSVSGEIRWTPNVAGEFYVAVTARLAGQTAGQSAVIARLNFPLYVRPTACATLRGEVRYSNTSATVQNAVVRVVASATSANVRNGGQLVYTAQVRNGQFTLPLPSGAYLLAVTGTDFNEVWWGNGIVPTTSMNTATPVTINCGDTTVRTFGVTRRAVAKFFALSGRVTRSATNAATQATIEVLGDAPPEIARETLRRIVRTDAQGNYRISLDDRFTYVVRALPDNRPTDVQTLPQYFNGTPQGTLNLSEARNITLTADVPNINFTLADRPVFQNSLSGIMQSTDGNPVAGRIIAFMTATTASTPQYASIDIRTETVSSSGTFTVKNLTPGEYVLQAFPASERSFSAVYYRAGTSATTLWRQATRITVTATSNDRFVIVLPSRRPSSATSASLNDTRNDATLTLVGDKVNTPTVNTAMVNTAMVNTAMVNTAMVNTANTNASNSAASEQNTQNNQTVHAATNSLTSVRNQTPALQMLSVAPNPASSLVIVQLPSFSGEARLEVCSLLGEEIFHATLPISLSQSAFPLDVTAFANGMYLVRFYAAETRASAQILVNR
jgi:hypothetical protein